jgi:hypothetical protein
VVKYINQSINLFIVESIARAAGGCKVRMLNFARVEVVLLSN